MSFSVSREQLLEVGSLVQERVNPALGSIYGVHPEIDRPAQFLGSGTYFSDGNDILMLTAMHVVQRSHAFKHVFHDLGSGEKMFPFRGLWIGHNVPETDLAIWGCFSEPFAGKSVRPLRTNDLMVESHLSPEAGFYCEGFPGEKHTVIHAMRSYRSVSHPMLGRFQALQGAFDPRTHFAFEYSNAMDPRGMSGSSVWNLNLHLVSALEEWNIDLITFAGVVHRWLPKDECLIATRCEQVRTFLPIAVEKLREMWRKAPNTDYK